MDLFGPMPTTSVRGNNYGLVYVCVATRYVAIRPLAAKMAVNVARVLWQLFSTFGFPKRLQSDNGSEFVNQVVEAMMQLTGVDRFIAAYNPQANGLAESMVKIVKIQNGRG